MLNEALDVARTSLSFLIKSDYICQLSYIIIMSNGDVANKMFKIVRRITSRDSGRIKRKKSLRGALVFLLNSAVLKFPLGRNLGHSTSRLAGAILLCIPHRVLSAP